MQEHLRALFVIVLLASFGFDLAKKIAPKDIPAIEINRWRNMWLSVGITAFIAHDFWIYIVVASLLIPFFTAKAANKMAIFFILLFVIPPISKAIPGMGLVNYLLTLSHPRFISLIILLPAAISISQKNTFTFGKIMADKLLLLYMTLVVCLQLRDTTFTDTLRTSIYMLTDVFLPYFVASRSIKNLTQMHNVIYAFLTSAIVLSIIGVFESTKHWLLYITLSNVLGADSVGSVYLGRNDDLRVMTTLGYPIAFGYFMAIAFGLYLYISNLIINKTLKRIGFLLLLLGLFVPLSRGPWIGAAATIVTFTLYGQNAFKKLSGLFFIAILTIPLLYILPNGQKYINLIPFIGETENGNIAYRQQLFNNSMIVINRSPFFGSSNYLQTPEMQELVQGQGIIDIVNTYIRVTLETGYIGLSLFVGVFISVLFTIRKQLKRLKDKTNPLYSLGGSLIATIVGIMITIATVSSVATIPTIYWSILGVGVAFTRMFSDSISVIGKNEVV